MDTFFGLIPRIWDHAPKPTNEIDFLSSQHLEFSFKMLCFFVHWNINIAVIYNIEILWVWITAFTQWFWLIDSAWISVPSHAWSYSLWPLPLVENVICCELDKCFCILSFVGINGWLEIPGGFYQLTFYHWY